MRPLLLLVLAAALIPMAPAGAADAELTFAEFYVDDFSITFSEKLKALNGQRVVVRGYMAPPLKPEGDFLVLTRYPVEICPFCANAEDWPIDILAVYLRRDAPHTSAKVAVTGTLDIGLKMDERLGFASLIRLENATVAR